MARAAGIGRGRPSPPPEDRLLPVHPEPRDLKRPSIQTAHPSMKTVLSGRAGPFRRAQQAAAVSVGEGGREGGADTTATAAWDEEIKSLAEIKIG